MDDTRNLAIFNAVIPHAASGQHQKIRIDDATLNLVESGLDSLDIVVLGAYLCELFDVPLETQKEIPSHNVQAMFAFLAEHGRRSVTGTSDVERMLGPAQ